jgi:hypothetical protein
MSPRPINTWINRPEHNLDLAWLVDDGADSVEEIVSRAANVLKRLSKGKFETFAMAVRSGGPEGHRVAAEAIYVYLCENHRLSYDKDRRFDPITGEQDIRSPDEAVKNFRVTCIDLVVLYLSCLANAGLSPIYIQVCDTKDDHSLAGALLYQPPVDRKALLSLDELNALLSAGRLLVVECTGFVDGYPPEKARGKLAFGLVTTDTRPNAIDEARKRLQGLATRDFGFALDVLRAREVSRPPRWWRDGSASPETPERVGKQPAIRVRRALVALGIGVVLAGSFLFARSSSSPATAETVLADSFEAPPRPGIHLTDIPPAGPGGEYPLHRIAGTISNLDLDECVDCSMVIYSGVSDAQGGQVWWVQPRQDAPYTPIRRDRSWAADAIRLGEEYAVLLVRPGFQPPSITESLPDVGGPVLAITRVEGSHADRR